jgi:CheY-like chemotaxis protein
VEQVGAADVARAGVSAPGDYVVLTVSDDGVGMSEATRTRIFEPFFTTKAPDRGTGLGLAAAWGIVRQSGGGIRVDSAPGEGSTFVVYLPTAARGAWPVGVFPLDASLLGDVPAAVDGAAPNGASPPRAAPGLPADVLGRTAASYTVLLAEDDHAVRRMTGRILRNAGYRVLEAGDGLGALSLWQTYGDEIDVMVADVRMPHLRGDALAEVVRVERPGFPVVLVTGFAEEPSGPALEGEGSPRGVAVLAKPFAAADLLAHVTAAIAAGASAAAVETPTGSPAEP